MDNHSKRDILITSEDSLRGVLVEIIQSTIEKAVALGNIKNSLDAATLLYSISKDISTIATKYEIEFKRMYRGGK